MLLYEAYQAQEDALQYWRGLARVASSTLGAAAACTPFNLLAREARAALDVFTETEVHHTRPDFGVAEVARDGARHPVREQVVVSKPFGDLLHFETPDSEQRPALLIVAPLSGHFATLLKDTVRVALEDHDVYITDWHNARDVPVSEGSFDLDDYTDYVMEFMRTVRDARGDVHVLAVCQPAVAAMSATALLAEQGDPATPASLAIMGGPIDTSVNPASVNDLARDHGLAWFEQNLITTVPLRFAGAGRRVYPGFMQLASFMSMNIDRHISAEMRQFRAHITGNNESQAAFREFYNEYLSVLDLPAEFYLDTVERVFQRQDLARGMLAWRGRPVDPGMIQNTRLLAVEGERDDICPPGQTRPMLDLCPDVPASHKRLHLQENVGHFGLFSGSRWRNSVYPVLKETITEAQAARMAPTAPRRKRRPR